MIRSPDRQPRFPRTALIAILAVTVAMLACPAWPSSPATAATAATAASPAAALVARVTQRISYRGITVLVPSSWPVFHLSARSSTCVRFNRHAVYLGRPGTSEDCPLQAAGRTEAILISPLSYRGLLTPVSRLAAGPAGGDMLRVTNRSRGVVITATWGSHPALIRRALGLRSLRQAMLATNGHDPAVPPGPPVRQPRASGHEVTSGAPATPGEVFAGLGFDTCTTQSEKAMSVWAGSSPYAAVGIYIGGANAACLGGNLNAAWVNAESAIGWHLLPIYVGLQAPGNGCGCQALSTTQTGGVFLTAANQGTAAAQDAVVQAQALGIGTGNPIYYDMENYKRSTNASGAVLAFLQAWTTQLHVSGYLSGVYSSGSSGIRDLVDSYGTSYVEPDELWTAAWDTSAPAPPPTSTANNYVPSGYWPNNQQLLQYYSDSEGKVERYGGVKIDVDRDFIDAATAAAGSTSLVSLPSSAPTIIVKPRPNGSVQLTPSWIGEPGVTQYAILGGDAVGSMTTVATVPATSKFPIDVRDVHTYYQVQAINSLGQVTATSSPVASPPSVAIFGRSAYVAARGPVGLPVACHNSPSPCRVRASIYVGRRLLASTGMRALPTYGAQLLVPLSPQAHRLIADAPNRRLPVSVRVLSSTGVTATRPLSLIPYNRSGAPPARHSWPSTALQILGGTSFVSHGWTGGVLAVCKSSQPCVASMHLSLAGKELAAPTTQTLGAGEIGYLTFRLNAQGHSLLRASLGNQLGARVIVSTAATPADNGGGAAIADSETAMALLSLVTFR